MEAYEDYKYLSWENGPSLEETQTLYKDLGIELWSSLKQS